MSTSSSPAEVNPVTCENLGRLHYLDTQAAELYSQTRHRLGPEAPGWLFEVEGRHRNRAARIAQYLRNHLIQPAGDERSQSAIAVLQQELADEQEVPATIALLRQLEHDLAALADKIMDSQAAWDDTDSWLSLAAPCDETLARVEDACQHHADGSALAVGNELTNKSDTI